MVQGAKPKVLITGINGQDGAYLAQKLLSDGISVSGTVRHVDADLWRLKQLGIVDQVSLSPMSFVKPNEADSVLHHCRPDWIVNLAAISSLGESEADAALTQQINFEGPRHLFRQFFRNNPQGRVFQASSALVFGYPDEQPQTELTRRQPDTHYGRAKNDLDAEILSLRNSGFFAVSGIFYNHESPLRGANFVSTKIVDGLVRLKKGEGEALKLGNLEDIRDWSHARDFADGIMLSMSADTSQDWVFASGHPHKVWDWIQIASRILGFDPKISTQEEAVEVVCGRTGVVLATGRKQTISETVAAHRVGCPDKLKQQLKWEPQYDFEALVEDMVHNAIRRFG